MVCIAYNENLFLGGGKTVTVSKILYILAYCIFLVGAAKSFRENGSKSSIWIMSCGVLLDVLISILPRTGMGFLQSDPVVMNTTIKFAIIFGVIFVWFLFPIALFVWVRGNNALFHFLIVVIEIAWFVDFIVFLYGLYKFPSM